jgi:hypothetical protein
MGSRAGEITLDWGGEADRLFRFGIGELRKIQEELDAGPTGIAARCMLSLAALEALRTSDFQALAHLSSARLAELVHVRVVFRQGLLGAKQLSMGEAEKLVREYIDERPLAENLAACYRLCMAAVLGPEDEPLGESEGEAMTPSPTESSASPTTTGPAPSSASAPATSTTAPSGKSPPSPKPGPGPTAATPTKARPAPKSTTR